MKIRPDLENIILPLIYTLIELLKHLKKKKKMKEIILLFRRFL